MSAPAAPPVAPLPAPLTSPPRCAAAVEVAVEAVAVAAAAAAAVVPVLVLVLVLVQVVAAAVVGFSLTLSGSRSAALRSLAIPPPRAPTSYDAGCAPLYNGRTDGSIRRSYSAMRRAARYSWEAPFVLTYGRNGVATYGEKGAVATLFLLFFFLQVLVGFDDGLQYEARALFFF